MKYGTSEFETPEKSSTHQSIILPETIKKEAFIYSLMVFRTVIFRNYIRI
jgi:hypothetical protein